MLVSCFLLASLAQLFAWISSHLIRFFSYLLYLRTQLNQYFYHSLSILLFILHLYYFGCLKLKQHFFNCSILFFDLRFIIFYPFLFNFNFHDFHSKLEFQIPSKAILFSFEAFSFFVYTTLIFPSIFLITIALFPFTYLFHLRFLYFYQIYLCYLAFSINTVYQKSQCETSSYYL